MLLKLLSIAFILAALAAPVYAQEDDKLNAHEAVEQERVAVLRQDHHDLEMRVEHMHVEVDEMHGTIRWMNGLGVGAFGVLTALQLILHLKKGK